MISDKFIRVFYAKFRITNLIVNLYSKVNQAVFCYFTVFIEKRIGRKLRGKRETGKYWQ